MKKNFVSIDPESGEARVSEAWSSLDDEDMAPVIHDSSGEPLEELSPNVLRGKSPQEFLRGKKPKIKNQRGKRKVEWEDKHSGLVASLPGVHPTADGDVGMVVLKSGLPGAAYSLEISREDVAVNLNEEDMVLDSLGNAHFKVKVYGLGDFVVKILPRDKVSFVPVELEVTVDKGRF